MILSAFRICRFDKLAFGVNNYWMFSVPKLKHFGILLNLKSSSKKTLYTSLGVIIPSKFMMKRILCKEINDGKFSKISHVFKAKKTRSMFVNFFYKLKVGLRFFMLFLIYGPLILIYPLIKWNFTLRRRWWSLILSLLQRSGPVLVKFGQWASTRRDLFSLEFCKLFSQLHTNTRPHSWSYSENLLKTTFGDNWRELFSEFNEKPCGSGCVAQVYKARLDPGDPSFVYVLNGISIDFDGPVDVAIKVLHPNIESKVETDLSVLKIIAYCLDKFYSRTRCLDLTKCVLEFEKTLKKQVDLQFEGEALKLFRSNFQRDPNVVFPKPLFQSPCILVETFEEGSHISNFIDSSDAVVKSELAQMGADALLKMIFVDNFVHGDLHPGNIIVQTYKEAPNVASWFSKLFHRNDDLKSTTRRRLVFLDVGLNVELSERDLANLQSVFKAVVNKEGKKVADLMRTQAPQQRCQNVEEFQNEVEKLVNAAHEQTVSLGQLHVSSLLSDLLNVAGRHQVNLEPKFTSIVLSVMVLEGLGRTLDPNLDLIKCARKFLFRSLT